MRTPEAFLALVLKRLGAAEIPCFVTGALGSSFHGRVRATNDFDLVIDPAPAQLGRFVKRLDRTIRVELEEARAAFRTGEAFPLIDRQSCWKIDLFPRRDRPFSLAEFARCRAVELLGQSVRIVSAEDAVLSGLEWTRRTGTARQTEDAAGILRVQEGRLDEEYLQTWSAALDLEADLAALRHRAALPAETNR